MANAAEQDLALDEYSMSWPYAGLICFNLLFLLPISTYLTYNYYLLRDSSHYYRARRPYLVILFCSIAIVFIGLYIPLHLIFFEIAWSNNNEYREWWDQAFFFYAQLFVFIAYILRTFHSFYDFKLGNSSTGNQWKSIINAEAADFKSIYIRNKSSFGRPQFTFKWFLIIPSSIWIIIFSFIIAFEVANNVEYILLSISFIYLSCCIILLIFIIFNTWRGIYDNIYLRGEIIFGCIIIILTVIGEFCVQAYDTLGGYNGNNDKYQQVYYFCFALITSLSCFTLIIISTNYVKYKIYTIEQKELKNQKLILIEQRQRTLDKNYKFNSSKYLNISGEEVDFQALISTPDGLQGFLSYLHKELNQNYLIFAMEITQFEEHALPKLVRKFKKMQHIFDKLLLFPDKFIPNSSIIYGNNKSFVSLRGRSYRTIYMELYLKYIDSSSALWPIKLPIEVANTAQELMRRCRVQKASKKSTLLITVDTQQSIMETAETLEELKEFVETLDIILEESIKILKDSFKKYKQSSDEFITWFKALNSSQKKDIYLKHERRLLMVETLNKLKNIQVTKQWKCDCTLINKLIYVGNKEYPPKSYCNCCGDMNNQQQQIFKKSKQYLTMGKYYNSKTKRNLSTNNITHAHPPTHKVQFSDESLGTDDDFDLDRLGLDNNNNNNNNKLDKKIVSEWNEMINEIYINPTENECDETVIDSCPQVQKVLFIIKYYNNVYLELNNEDFIYKINSMSGLINNLEDFNMSELLEDYRHVSETHFKPPLFEFFEEEIGVCDGGARCKAVSRNRKEDPNQQRPLKRVKTLNDDRKEEERMDEEEEKQKQKQDTLSIRRRPIKRQITVSKGIDYFQNGFAMNNDKQQEQQEKKDTSDEERITLQWLDKMHSFLFHPTVKEEIIIKEDNEQDDAQDEEEDIVNNNNMITKKETILGANGNKYILDASVYGNLVPSLSSSNLNILNNVAEDNNNSNKNNNLLIPLSDDNKEGEQYYEYLYGQHFKYHQLSPNPEFICMKDELICNSIHNISEKVWDETLAKALVYLDLESISTQFTANDHGYGDKYGIKQGDLIGIDNVISILFYCNFDTFQRKFSSTFRKLDSLDTNKDIEERHCNNYYWYGRALYVAVSFYGKRMRKQSVVWHGLSSRMVFSDFVSYFDCPTSTTTQKAVAQSFSGDGHGIILRLKSKHKTKCSFQLDVSVFSDYTDECERLFLMEPLFITDILHIDPHNNNRWRSNRDYMSALLFFNKITTGMSADSDWNISEKDKIQNLLSDIITDFLTTNSRSATEKTRKTSVSKHNAQKKEPIPQYIRVLFNHYCSKKILPRFDDIHKIHKNITMNLRMHLFDKILPFNDDELNNKKQKISETKIHFLFPNCLSYVNDQGVEIKIRKKRKNMHKIETSQGFDILAKQLLQQRTDY